MFSAHGTKPHRRTKTLDQCYNILRSTCRACFLESATHMPPPACQPRTKTLMPKLLPQEASSQTDLLPSCSTPRSQSRKPSFETPSCAGEFKAPMRVHDDRSLLEAQLWQQALQDSFMLATAIASRTKGPSGVDKGIHSFGSLPDPPM